MEQGFFHPVLGYWQTLSAPSDSAVAEYPEGTASVPLKPGAGYEWDGSNWVEVALTTAQLAAEARAKRDTLLAESDVYVLPDRWAVMTPEQQAAWTAYRQDLRDITAQPGFPSDIVWPAKP